MTFLVADLCDGYEDQIQRLHTQTLNLMVEKYVFPVFFFSWLRKTVQWG